MLQSICLSLAAFSAPPYTPDWASLDSRPMPGWFAAAKFGIKMHWGMYSVPSYNDFNPHRQDAAQYWRFNQAAPGCPKAQQPNCKGFPYGKMGANNSVRAFHQRAFPGITTYDEFKPMFTAPLFNATAWAELFAASGARYMRPVVKFGDGWTHWSSNTTGNWSSPHGGPRRDIVGELFIAARAFNLKTGVHFELSEWLDPETLKKVLPAWRADALSSVNPVKYRDTVVWTQLTQLVEKYQPDDIYTDSEWDWSSDWWRSRDWLAWLFNDSPVRDHVIVNDRWGNETRGKHGGYFVCEYAACTGPNEHGHAWTKTLSINSRFGYNRHDRAPELRNASFLIKELMHSASQGGNLDLSVDAMGDGRIDPYHEAVLLEIGGWLRANGEAVYNTRIAPQRQNFTTTSGTLFFFTAAAAVADGTKTLFATATTWPGASFSLPLDGRPCPPTDSVSLLGDASVTITAICKGDELAIAVGTPPMGCLDGGAAMRNAWSFRVAW